MTAKTWGAVLLSSLVFGVVAALADGTRARFTPPPSNPTGTAPIVVTGSVISCTAATTSTAGCVSASAQTISGLKTFADGVTSTAALTGLNLTGTGAASSYQLRLNDTTNAKNWYFTDNNDTLVIANNAAATMLSIDNTGAWANFLSTKNRGTITLSGGTGTATVNASAICVCDDGTAVAAVRCALSGTTLTATGTTTDAINYHCF